MSIRAVAEKDFRDAIRSRLMIAVAVMFVAFTGGGVALGAASEFGGDNALGVITLLMLRGTSVFIPIIALGIAFKSIAGERESGSLKVLLSLPNSRLDVVIGKFLGRTAVVLAAVVVGFVSLLVAAAIAFSGDLDVMGLVAFMLAALLLGIVFVSIAVSLSAFTKSTFGAAVGAGSVFVLFQFAWAGLVFLLRYAVNGFDWPSGERPDWAEVLTSVNPMEGWRTSANWLVNKLAESGETGQNGADAFYLEPWFGFVVLALWIVLPLVVGYLRFEYSDL
ncbi:ABC transporter [Halobacteriales archaeon QS_1_69_70]|nr:MAG: ABC transporter [Halobacteriales archaeon QS_1_69_70]